jgi:hypothetical protein
MARYPSIKAIEAAFGQWLLPGQAKEIRTIMEGPGRVDVQQSDCQWLSLTRMQRIDKVLGTCGVEYIPKGHNAKSPAILYCNTGDTYDTTILKINGRFRIGCWGDIVERGNYD